MREAVAVLYNVTSKERCFETDLSGPAGGPGVETWLYQFCTEAQPQEMPFWPATGVADMFWDQGGVESVNAMGLILLDVCSAGCLVPWGPSVCLEPR
jgi:hypothetical protein